MIKNTRDRYLVFTIHSASNNFDESKIKKVIWQNYQKIYGLSGSSGAGLYFEFFNPEEKSGIIRCSQHSLARLQSILALITRIGDSEMVFQSVFVSGTINKAKKHYLFNSVNPK